jgi:carbonic anhydrase/acetyltransferase-like protein (isoleucine patch superfamily)
MAIVKKLGKFTPDFGIDCFLTENAVIIGDVVMGDRCSVWFNAVIRGDVNSIRIGHNVNIQDGSVLHCTWEKTTIDIGNNVTIGHNVILHGATIGNNVLIGMGAIIMDNAIIGDNSIVAAGAVVLENSVVEPGTIWAGVPAKQVKNPGEEIIREKALRSAENYLTYMNWYREG